VKTSNLTEDKVDDMEGSFYEELERVFDKFPEYHVNNLLGDFKAKVHLGREPTTGNGNLHKISNDNGVRCFHIVMFTNLLGHLLMERHTSN
jgi:hypothetical protein